MGGLSVRPLIGCPDHVAVIIIHGLLRGNQSSYVAGHFGHVTNLVRSEAAAEERLLLIIKPFLDDLIPADGEVPHRLGFVPPVGAVVPLNQFSLTRHGHAALARMAPPGGQIQIAHFGVHRFPVCTLTGVMGAAAALPDDVRRDVARIKAMTPLSVAVGFGISTPAQAAAITPLANGVVIGSALVRLIAEKGKSADLIPTVSAYAGGIRRAIDAARPGQKSGE
jgi:hypothetical protein